MYVGEACCLNFRFSLIYFYILEAEAEYTESDIFVDTSISEFRLLIKKIAPSPISMDYYHVFENLVKYVQLPRDSTYRF